MDELIAWAGFLGAWLLVAGPIFQASLELAEEEFERESYHDAMVSVGRPARVSPWWWLVPPAHVYLSRRGKDAWWRDFVRLLDDEQYEQFRSYRSKATGWLIVGTGGLLIAVKETGELVETYEWPPWLTGLVAPVALLVSLGYTVARTRRDAQARAERGTPPG